MNEATKSIILFDGYCNLCSGAIQFILQRDKKKNFKYASLQSDFGKDILQRNGLSSSNIDTVVLIENGMAFTYSTAIIKIARRLSGLWPIFYGSILIPKFIRDGMYKYIAKNRYRWFGKKETCLMFPPTQE